MIKSVASLALAACLFATASGAQTSNAQPPAPKPAEAKQPKPKGWSDKSYYLTMRDGTRIALSLYFPLRYKPANPGNDKYPVLLFQTRYGRADSAEWQYMPWTRNDYVVAVIDTRGSTSSFGTRLVDIGPEEVRDMDEVIAHLAAQPWSMGKVITTGGSYLADTADWATSRPAPALVGAVPYQADFDVYLNLFFPGGVANDWFRNGWAENAREIDLGRDGEGNGLDCRIRAADCPKLFPTLQPVDDDADYSQLRQALNGKGAHWGPESYAEQTFRDDKGTNGYTMFGSSPASALAGIRQQRKPVQYWGSWMDAGTADAALARFRSAPEVPAELWITANNHSQHLNGDPFAPARKLPIPALDSQYAIRSDFHHRILDGGKVDRIIHYYVMGADVMKQTRVWPPEGTRVERLSLAPGKTLTSRAPKSAGVDDYAVDYAATTGDKTRWSTQGGNPPAYPDRREADKKLIVYDGPPQVRDMELAGYPVVTLNLSASHDDPAIFAYLESVAPDGRVTMITEGQLRAVHRKIADPKSLPYDQGPVPRSFNRADAQPVVPGQVMELRFPLLPTAVLIRKGHRLRLAIAGADADTFRRYPAKGESRFQIHHGGRYASSIELPMRPWQP